MSSTRHPTTDPYSYARDEGPAYWFAGTLVTVKATGADTNGSFSLVEQLSRADFGPPLHVHHEDDELFSVLEGEATFWVGDEIITAPAGSMIYLPHGIPHSFRTEEDGTRLYQFAYPPGFENFFEAVGEPAARRELPPPTEPDVEAMVAVAEDFGFEILGPPPWIEH
ncbi:MAG: quercetin 2,3-dioxygenase [Halobacteriales archaeon]|nr:quercetin 2,3-dioxygenase [Halobacteriales archaeon]